MQLLSDFLKPTPTANCRTVAPSSNQAARYAPRCHNGISNKQSLLFEIQDSWNSSSFDV